MGLAAGCIALDVAQQGRCTEGGVIVAETYLRVTEPHMLIGCEDGLFVYHVHNLPVRFPPPSGAS
jgi:hypothetical protein